nr:PREDICTED: brain-specific serine protease 4-like [Anolis carolinensis]|eukprot:XP_016854062.1 PREDICTED: brain-specific serine protease 4-like [Anolis carolinensis]
MLLAILIWAAWICSPTTSRKPQVAHLSSYCSSLVCGFRQQRPNLDRLPEESEEPEAPWIVNIFGNGNRCQGVVLSSWWVLTAANCFLSMMPSHVELTGASGRTATETVSQFVPHKGFSSWDEQPNNDLGLVLLGQPLDLAREDVWPACIPSDDTASNTREECKIFERNEKGSIQETKVNGLETSECAIIWPDTKKELNLCVARNMSNGTYCTVKHINGLKISEAYEESTSTLCYETILYLTESPLLYFI